MSDPRRIQRKRTKGWRMPRGAVYVGRPTIWGNPWSIDDVLLIASDLDAKRPDDRVEAARRAVRRYREELGHWGLLSDYRLRAYEDTYQRLRFQIDCSGARNIGEYAAKVLRGKNLACWCPLDQPCHADVLLEMANKGGDA